MVARKREGTPGMFAGPDFATYIDETRADFDEVEGNNNKFPVGSVAVLNLCWQKPRDQTTNAPCYFMPKHTLIIPVHKHTSSRAIVTDVL